MNITELYMKRVLIVEKELYRNTNVVEAKVVEISPSGNWVKLMNMHGSKYWKPVSEISLVEVLKDIKPKKQD